MIVTIPSFTKFGFTRPEAEEAVGGGSVLTEMEKFDELQPVSKTKGKTLYDSTELAAAWVRFVNRKRSGK